jgi:mediator of RNA polymerase II transcription subunit 12
LDSSDVTGEIDNIRAVSLLFGKLIKHELFSYASYIQRLIARGEPGLSYAEVRDLFAFQFKVTDLCLKEHGSRHRNFLRWIPLQKVTSSLISQRRVTLHGTRARETDEDLNEREIRKEIREILPELFGGWHTTLLFVLS